jgi:glycosyltransferase involved in cell wall biosynthesis
MSRVAILHNTLDFRGGADAVCLAACEALRVDHEVTLFTLSETSPVALADRFDVDFEGIRVRMPPGAETLARALSSLGPWIGSQLAFRSVLLQRFFRPRAAAFDLAVSTANELSLPIPSVQYVHYPQFHARRRRGPVDQPPDADAGRLNRLWTRLAGPSRAELAGSGVTLIANSAWTADVVAGIYGTRPDVLHPPVDPIPCERAWRNRKNGVVVVGRLAPDKRVLDAIAVVDGVRERGHDLHLHLVGAAPRSYRRYAERVEAAASERSYVSVERDVSRARLEDLLCTHRYGLNTKPEEHFGMSLAEYVAAGMAAFAPASGGQRDVLDGREDRLFDSVEEAVELLARAVEADEPPDLPRDRFARERFGRALRRHVSRAID